MIRLLAFAALLAIATAANLDIKLDDGAIAFGASLDTVLSREANNTLKTGNLLADRLEVTDRVSVGNAVLSPASLHIAGASAFDIEQPSTGGIAVTSGGNVQVQNVQFSPSGDVSGLANNGLSIADNGGSTNVTHGGGGDLHVRSTTGVVLVQGAVFADGGSLAAASLSLAAGGVAVNADGEVTVAAAAALTLTSTAAAIAHDAATGDLTVESVNGDVIVEGITLSGQDITGVASLTASGAVTADSFSTGAGNVDLASDGSIVSYSKKGLKFDNSDVADTPITHTGGLGAGNLVISSGSNVVIETVVFDDGALSAVKSVAISQTIDFTGTTAGLTHTGASGNLVIGSNNGNTVVEGVSFASSGVAVTIDGSQPLKFPTTSNAVIEHTGSGAGDLQITSTAGSVMIESIGFTGDTIERVGGDLMLSTDGDIKMLADAVFIGSTKHQNNEIFTNDVITPDGSMSDLIENKVHIHDMQIDIKLDSSSGSAWFPWDILGAPEPWAVYHWIGGAPTVHEAGTCNGGPSAGYWIEPWATGIGQNGSYTMHVIDSTSAYFQYKGFTKLSDGSHVQVAAGFSSVEVYAAITNFPDDRWRAIGMAGHVASTPFSCYSLSDLP